MGKRWVRVPRDVARRRLHCRQPFGAQLHLGGSCEAPRPRTLVRVAGEQEAHSWDSHADVWQRILNEVEEPARSAQKDSPQPIPVVARICWERDGDETVDTVVHVWTSGLCSSSLWTHADATTASGFPPTTYGDERVGSGRQSRVVGMASIASCVVPGSGPRSAAREWRNPWVPHINLARGRDQAHRTITRWRDMSIDGELDQVLAEVLGIQAAVLRCADARDEGAPAEVERLTLAALAEGCPPRTAISLLVRAFTA
jgi:hypothetical protein